jgi:hypothetical protein
VQRRQIVEAQLALQAHEQALLHVFADRRDRQEMGLVHGQQVFVPEQDGFVERDAALGLERAVVVDAQPCFVGPSFGDRHAVLVDHLARAHARFPGAARDGGEALHQELGDGGPGPGRQRDAARADAVAGGQRQRGGHGRFAQAISSADTISAKAGRAAGSGCTQRA